MALIGRVRPPAKLDAEDDYTLRMAARNGHYEVVKYLVEHGANIHAKDEYALQMAAKIAIMK